MSYLSEPRSLVHLFLGVCVSGYLHGCSPTTSPAEKIHAPSLASDYLGMALVATDAQFSSSELFFYDFASGAIDSLRSGLSGDPEIFAEQNELWFFNRSAGLQNFFKADFTSLPEALSAEQSFSAAGPGDPHAVLSLASGHLLLANMVHSSLVIMDVANGKVIQSVEADWDLPSGATLRPESLWSDGEKQVLLLHQGLSDSYRAVGGQQIFVFKFADETLSVVDLDLAKARVQGVPLAMSVPERFEQLADGRLLVFGTCSAYTGDDCKAAVQVFNPRTLQIEFTWQLDELGLIMNGISTLGATDNDVIANVIVKDSDTEQMRASIVNLDLSTRTTRTLHTYDLPALSAGIWLTAFDRSSQSLFVGEARSQANGTLIIYQDGVETTRVAFPRIPYKGALIAK